MSRAAISALALTVVVAGLPAARVHGQAPAIAPDFTLVSQDRVPVRLSQFRGKFVLLSFIYTHCVDICPLATARMAALQRELQSRKWSGTRVVLLTMTFDPKRDTPAVMKSYAAKFRADHRGWHFLSGEPDAVLRTVKAYKIPVRAASRPGLIEHALPILVIDRQGRILGHYEHDFNPKDAIRDLTHLLAS